MDATDAPQADQSARSHVPALLATGLTLLGGLALSWPAFHNGFPLVFQDSAWYVGPLVDAGQHPLRTIGYTLFASIALTIPSFWSIVLAQALTTSALLTRVAWLAADRPGDRPRLAVLGLLSVLLLSGAAKYSSWLMADITTPWIFLAGALWFLAPGRWDRCIAIVIGGIAVLAHNSHLPLALATSSIVAAVGLWRGAGPARRAALGLLAATCLFVPGVWIANAMTSGRAEVLRAPAAFLLYNLSDSGVLLDTLDAWCDEREWQMCSFRPEIAEHVGEKKGWLLFDGSSPFYRVGGYASAEVADVVLHAFRCCTPQIVWTVAEDAWFQFWEIDSQDGLSTEDTNPTVHLLQLMARPGAAQQLKRMDAGWGRFRRETARRELVQLRTSRQRTGGDVRVLLHPLPESWLQAALLLLGAFIAFIALRSGDARPAYLLGSALLFLALNAGICEFGSSINGRYQGRVAWLLPFAIAIAGWWTWRSSTQAFLARPRSQSPRRRWD